MLAHGPQALNHCEPADSPAPDRLARDADGRVEAAMVTDGERHAVLRRSGQKGATRRDGVGNRLLHQHRQPALGARDADLGMTVVRGGDDRAVEPLPGQQLAPVLVEAGPVSPDRRSRRVQRIRNRDDRARGLLLGEREMPRADAAGTEQRESKRIDHEFPSHAMAASTASCRCANQAPPDEPRALFGFPASPVKRGHSRCA